MAMYEPRRGNWTRSSLTAIRRKQLCWHFYLKLLASRSVRNAFLFLKPLVLWHITMYGNPSKLTQSRREASCSKSLMRTIAMEWGPVTGAVASGRGKQLLTSCTTARLSTFPASLPALWFCVSQWPHQKPEGKGAWVRKSVLVSLPGHRAKCRWFWRSKWRVFCLILCLCKWPCLIFFSNITCLKQTIVSHHKTCLSYSSPSQEM